MGGGRGELCARIFLPGHAHFPGNHTHFNCALVGHGQMKLIKSRLRSREGEGERGEAGREGGRGREGRSGEGGRERERGEKRGGREGEGERGEAGREGGRGREGRSGPH